MRLSVKKATQWLVLSFLVSIAILYFLASKEEEHEGEGDLFEKKSANRPGHGPGMSQQNSLGEKTDWHNYAKIEAGLAQKGPGEQGKAFVPPSLSPQEFKKKQTLYSVNGFNAYASDQISLYRHLKDIRHPDCKIQKYLAKLPTVSVVVPFHNEHFTTLMRTAASVVNQSPPHLLHEVILADDASTKESLGVEMEKFLKTHEPFGGKVKVVRHKQREGLIRARILGAKYATGEVLLFLDAHCEANINFLPPLLEPIAENRRTATCPFIDVLDYETFAYRAQDDGARGAFDWEFFYKRLPLHEDALKHPARPFESPVMAGGLFAIDRKWFWELGGYDPGLDIWGGEQYELSFKVWQCHGRMLDTPCSRIGHVYRKFAPFPNPGIGDFVGRNFRRVAEVWMDEYAEHLYDRRPAYRNIDPRDLTDQKAIRAKLQCKSFKWFMTNVLYDLDNYYPPVEPMPKAKGQIRNKGTDLCVDTNHRPSQDRFGVYPCQKAPVGKHSGQSFQLSWHRDIRLNGRSMCLDVATSIDYAPIVLFNCHGMNGNQLWKYNLATSQLFHHLSGQCLDCNTKTQELHMRPCDTTSASQRWLWDSMNTTLVQELWSYKPK